MIPQFLFRALSLVGRRRAKLSAVFTLAALVASVKRDVIAALPGRTAELLFVDDGSGDGSLTVLRSLQSENPGLIRIVKLTRNFGQVNALFAGFDRARGQCAICISADGQDPAAAGCHAAGVAG